MLAGVLKESVPAVLYLDYGNSFNLAVRVNKQEDKMKVAVFVQNGVIEYREIEESQTRPGTIKVKASDICGLDIPEILLMNEK